MKKMLILAGAVLLIAAACNSQQAGNTPGAPAGSAQSGSNPTASGDSVDATVNDLNTSVNSETTINSQSDTDLLNTDQAVVNDATGVSNANY